MTEYRVKLTDRPGGFPRYSLSLQQLRGGEWWLPTAGPRVEVAFTRWGAERLARRMLRAADQGQFSPKVSYIRSRK